MHETGPKTTSTSPQINLWMFHGHICLQISTEHGLGIELWNIEYKMVTGSEMDEFLSGRRGKWSQHSTFGYDAWHVLWR